MRIPRDGGSARLDLSNPEARDVFTALSKSFYFTMTLNPRIQRQPEALCFSPSILA